MPGKKHSPIINISHLKKETRIQMAVYYIYNDIQTPIGVKYHKIKIIIDV